VLTINILPFFLYSNLRNVRTSFSDSRVLDQKSGCDDYFVDFVSHGAQEDQSKYESYEAQSTFVYDPCPSVVGGQELGRDEQYYRHHGSPEGEIRETQREPH